LCVVSGFKTSKYAKLNVCPVCKESRWKDETEGTEAFSTAAKVEEKICFKVYF
jgi:hypothetical protein